MKFLQALIIAISLLTASVANAELNVVTTLPDLGAVARTVGGEHVSVNVMISPNQDPHFADARPNLTLMLNQADLLIVNGLGLEVGWLPKLQTNARNAKIQVGADGFLDASTLVKLLGQQQVDRAMGDVHPGGNPHYNLDPNRMADVAVGIGFRLSKLDPENAASYKLNAAKFASAAREYAAKERQRFDSLKTRKVVAYHESLIYLKGWLALDVVIHVEPRPGVPPDPGHVAKVLKRMKGESIKVILQESFYPKSTSQTLVKMVKGKLVVIPGGAADGQDYLARIKAVSDSIYEALK